MNYENYSSFVRSIGADRVKQFYRGSSEIKSALGQLLFLFGENSYQRDQHLNICLERAGSTLKADDKSAKFLKGQGAKELFLAFHYDLLTQHPGTDGLDEINQIIFAPRKTDDRPKLSARASAILTLTNSYMSARMNGAEPHAVADKFFEFMKTHQKGYWLLTAGPGMGKTSIMAQIMQRMTRDQTIIPYFFIQPFQKTAEQNFEELGNTKADFFSFAFDLLSHLFPETETQFQVPALQNGKALGDLLFHLSDRDMISAERPLIFVLDGLDEIQGEGLSANPLNLPRLLPDHVYVAHSTRIESRSEAEFDERQARLPYHTQSETLGWGDGGTLHARTIVSLARRICEQNTFVAPYHEPKQGRSASEFLDEICIDVGYNAMILTCILNEKHYWESGGTGSELTASLKDYFKKHFERMSRFYKGRLQMNPVYCLSLDTEISEINFFRLGAAKDDAEALETLSEQVGEWDAQGLVVTSYKDGVTWLKPYHRTYREFLAEEANTLKTSQFSQRALENLASHVNIDDLGEEFPTEQTSIQREWLKLWLKLALKANDLNKLAACLRNLHAWLFCERTDEKAQGYQLIMLQVAMIYPAEQSLRDYTAFYDKLGAMLIDWISEGLLISSSEQRSYRLDEFIDMVTHANRYRTPGAISLSDYLKV